MTSASLHERVASVLDRSGSLEAVLRVRRAIPVATLDILTFHRIAEPGEDPFDPEVIDATPAQFRRHVETLLRHGTPIDLPMLLDALEGHALPRNAFAITFDDGYRSCAEVVLPILRELGVPATFFIASGFPDAGTLYWWEQIAVIVARARRRVATLSYPRPLDIDAGDPRARRVLDDLVKNTNGLDLERFLQECREAFEVDWSPAIEQELARELIMSWDEIAALAAAGMSIESHTRKHRVLETLGRDELRDELIGAREDLETRLGRPVRAIAYPVGRPPSPRVRRAVAEAGYRVGFTNATGVNHVWPAPLGWVRRFDAYAIRRQAMDRAASDAMFLTQLAMPSLAY